MTQHCMGEKASSARAIRLLPGVRAHGLSAYYTCRPAVHRTNAGRHCHFRWWDALSGCLPSLPFRFGMVIMAQRSDEGDGFPIAVRQLLDEPLALRCPPVETGNRRCNASFIDEDEALRIKPWLLLLQRLTCGGDVRPVLLGGPQTFF